MSLMLRLRQLALLLPRLARAVPWSPVTAAAVLSALLTVPVLAESEPSVYSTLSVLRLAAIVLGTGAGFAMIDAMAPMTVTPTPRWLRQWLRTALVVLPAAACWAALYAAARSVHRPGDLGPGIDLTVEAAVCALTGITAVAVTARYRHATTDALAGPGAQAVALACTLFLTGARSPWQLPAADEWADIHHFWYAAGALLAVVLLWANRDVGTTRRPYRRHPVTRPR